MQEITYASKSFVTTDEVADCLLRLVTAIGREEHSEAVTVPAFDDTGRQVEAKMTLDAGSELVVVPVELNIDDTFDQAAVSRALSDIHSRIDRRTNANTATYSDAHEAVDLDLDDLI